MHIDEIAHTVPHKLSDKEPDKEPDARADGPAVSGSHVKSDELSHQCSH